MNDIESITADLASGKSANEIRSKLINAIERQIDSLGEDMGNWERSFLAGAIGAISANIQIGNDSSRAWLRLSLTNLAKATVPADRRSESSTTALDDASSITRSFLIDALNKLKSLNGI